MHGTRGGAGGDKAEARGHDVALQELLVFCWILGYDTFLSSIISFPLSGG